MQSFEIYHKRIIDQNHYRGYPFFYSILILLFGDKTKISFYKLLLIFFCLNLTKSIIIVDWNIILFLSQKAHVFLQAKIYKIWRLYHLRDNIKKSLSIMNVQKISKLLIKIFLNRILILNTKFITYSKRFFSYKVNSKNKSENQNNCKNVTSN